MSFRPAEIISMAYPSLDRRNDLIVRENLHDFHIGIPRISFRNGELVDKGVIQISKSDNEYVLISVKDLEAASLENKMSCPYFQVIYNPEGGFHWVMIPIPEIFLHLNPNHNEAVAFGKWLKRMDVNYFFCFQLKPHEFYFGGKSATPINNQWTYKLDSPTFRHTLRVNDKVNIRCAIEQLDSSILIGIGADGFEQTILINEFAPHQQLSPREADTAFGFIRSAIPQFAPKRIYE
jgi:hypothetical protein